MIDLEDRKFALSFLKGLWIYTLMLWIYNVADMFPFPQYQYAAISRLIPIPQNLIAVIALPVSFIAFIGWEYLRTLDIDLGKSVVKNETVTGIRI
jgi:hypothetical protein